MRLYSAVQALVWHRGRVLDALTSVAQLWLLADSLAPERAGPSAEPTSAGTIEPHFRWLLLAALGAYTAGAALKRAPFQARVSALEAPVHAGCLCAAWLVLHSALCILAAAACVADAPEIPLVVQVAVMAAVSVLPTAMAAQLLVRPRRAPVLPAWRTHPLCEGVADLLIGAAVLLCTWFWSEHVAELFFADFPGAGFGDRLVGSLLAAGSFAMFYAAPRFLFLLEDHARWGTWLSMSPTLLPLLVRMWL